MAISRHRVLADVGSSGDSRRRHGSRFAFRAPVELGAEARGKNTHELVPSRASGTVGRSSCRSWRFACFMTAASEHRGDSPGWLAKASVAAAAAVYFGGLYFNSARGADLQQGAILQLLVPFVLVAPAWFVGLLAHSVPRRTPAARRQLAGDVAFACVMLTIVAALVAAARAR